jgi:hypothetical protein
VGGLIIGMSGNDKGMAVIKPYLIDPFYGILGLFLLELGLVAARRLKEIDGFPKALALFGVYMPLVAATISLTTSYLLGFDLGTTILLTTLAASASYIAVPAAMKIALPDANPAYYVTLDAAAVSAHCGSVSAVTFSYAMGYIKNEGIIFEGYLVTLMALMEFPAILSGLILAKRSRKLQNQSKEKLLSGKIIREVFLNGSIVLLVGGLIIGMSGNDKGMAVIKPYLIDPFYGILGLFLLELGLVAARRLKEIDGFPKALALFGVYMPLVAATISLTTSYLLGFDLGTTILLTTLAASASYIAVPAAMKIALPDANPAYYVTLSLCITFPFNLIIGVPLYTELAKFIN